MLKYNNKSKTSKFNIGLFYTLVCFLCFLNYVDADDLVLNIVVDTKGEALIYGSYDGSNIVLPEGITIDNGSISGQTDYITNKYGPDWQLNISFDIKLDYCIFIISLPSEATLNDIDQGEMDKSIDITEDNFKVTTQGWNITNPYTIITYKLEELDKEDDLKADLMKYLLILIVSVLLIILASFIIKKIPKLKSGIDIDEDEHAAVAKTLNERENEVLDALIDVGGRSTQKELNSYTEIPRASLARIVEHLYAKKVIKKWKYGKTNRLEVHERLIKK